MTVVNKPELNVSMVTQKVFITLVWKGFEFETLNPLQITDIVIHSLKLCTFDILLSLRMSCHKGVDMFGATQYKNRC